MFTMTASSSSTFHRVSANLMRFLFSFENNPGSIEIWLIKQTFRSHNSQNIFLQLEFFISLFFNTVRNRMGIVTAKGRNQRKIWMENGNWMCLFVTFYIPFVSLLRSFSHLDVERSLFLLLLFIFLSVPPLGRKPFDMARTDSKKVFFRQATSPLLHYKTQLHYDFMYSRSSEVPWFRQFLPKFLFGSDKNHLAFIG